MAPARPGRAAAHRYARVLATLAGRFAAPRLAPREPAGLTPCMLATPNARCHALSNPLLKNKLRQCHKTTNKPSTPTKL